MVFDPATDPAAQAGFALCDRVLELLGGRGEALVTHSTGISALTRFANSRIHQNVAEEQAHIRLKVALDGGKVAQATTTRVDPEGIERLVETTVAAARLRPADPDFPGMAPAAEAPVVNHHDAATTSASPDVRASIVAEFVSAAEGMEAAGYCSTEGTVHVLCSSAGARMADRSSMAQLDGIHRAEASSGPPTDGYAQVTSVRVGDLDGTRCGAVAAQKARAGADPVELPPGTYEVVLEPRAVASVLLFPAWLGFNGKAHAEGTSFVHLGEAQLDEHIDIWDDATDQRSLGRGYDAEGTPKRRVDLVARGVSVGLVHDRRSAAQAGVEPTGHSIGEDSFGGYPGDLFLGDGDTSVEDLVASVERGLLVTDLWYNRILDPKTQVVTGLTRNGLFLVEGGEVVGPVQNLRYTQSVVAALGPGHVLGVGDDGQLVSNEGGVVHCPSLHLASWSFTGGARG